MAMYRWRLGTIHKNIHHFLWNIKIGICNVIRWAPIVWNDLDFDWEPLARIMEYKLRRMSKVFANGHLVHSDKHSRQMLICAELLKRLITNEVHRPYNRVNVLRHINRMREWEHMLGVYIGKHLRSWWD